MNLPLEGPMANVNAGIRELGSRPSCCLGSPLLAKVSGSVSLLGANQIVQATGVCS